MDFVAGYTVKTGNWQPFQNKSYVIRIFISICAKFS